ncbi:hydroxymyristoyl-ACP dehydratase [Aureisphaera galaxeae]|uniref:3-hydroxyacyl-ACP dehydratase FabZ family protein n=1 Tax=Aureisphaera galaxeae TaxID=1538023 RepID=UPI00235062B0|nr:hydroxymyristoyl-ACP dehydratase [Aureisphaera galaxeae]MDC8004224.1 hydroxymyristoyl-ACP dehydratase [Aureisphaera galaxeae]
MKHQEIIAQLPYEKPFLFVDALDAVSDDGAQGTYTFAEDEYFYQGHFKGNPITPGVILTECMAQIGVVCLGIHLIDGLTEDDKIALVSNEVHFYEPVLPGEKVTVISEKEYFRFGKLKCQVKMLNENEKVVCKGTISGIIFQNKKES